MSISIYHLLVLSSLLFYHLAEPDLLTEDVVAVVMSSVISLGGVDRLESLGS